MSRDQSQQNLIELSGGGGAGSSLCDFHMKLYRAFHAQRACLRPFATHLGLGSGQPKLLSYIAAHGSCTQRELAEFFEIDPAAVSRMLDLLEKEGFISCRPATDRRTKVTELTDRGQAAIILWDERCAEVEVAMLDGFTPEQRELFGSYLERARANMRKLASKKRGSSDE